VREFSIRRHSGGAGAFSGGNGVIRKLEFRKAMTAAILSNRRRTEPFGLAGGQPGQRGSNYLIRQDGTRQQLRHTDSFSVQAGDVLVIETPGGGGYGKPVRAS
jgi:5-oxoprolinase (ATP-hydrolysing)